MNLPCIDIVFEIEQAPGQIVDVDEIAFTIGDQNAKLNGIENRLKKTVRTEKVRCLH